MEQFEKQWKVQQEINCWGESGHDKNVAKVIWKAALKWAKAMHDVSNEPRFSLRIKEELNGN